MPALGIELVRHAGAIDSSAESAASYTGHLVSLHQRRATAVTLLRMEAMGQRGVPRAQKTRSQRARGLEHKQERAWPMAAESNASIESGTACKVVSTNGAARVGNGQGSMRATVIQGTAGYVTRMSGGVGGRGREVPSYPE